MRILIRADSSTRMGSGHVMRTVTLADELRLQGADVTFITRRHAGNMIDYLEGKGYPVLVLEGGSGQELQTAWLYADDEEESWLGTTWQEDCLETREKIQGRFSGQKRIDWLIVDHYSLDSRWESSLGEVTDRVMALDDLANREHDSDILLDQNLFENMWDRYQDLVPDRCQMLLGPEFALIRPEFVKSRISLGKREGNIERILLFFGGSDPANITMKVLKGMDGLTVDGLHVDVVTGYANRNSGTIHDYCLGRSSVNYHHNIDYMAELMAGADLFVGSGGTSTWERCCLGLPSIVIAIAGNQEELSLNTQQYGLSVYLGPSHLVEVDHILAEIDHLRERPDLVRKMSLNCIKMVDGKGASRVAALMGSMTGA